MRPWLVLAASIIALDAYLIQTGQRTLSQEYAAASREHPLLVTAGTAYLLAHLYAVLPVRLDALHRFGCAQG
jgi:hypothetical protein